MGPVGHQPCAGMWVIGQDSWIVLFFQNLITLRSFWEVIPTCGIAWFFLYPPLKAPWFLVHLLVHLTRMEPCGIIQNCLEARGT